MRFLNGVLVQLPMPLFYAAVALIIGAGIWKIREAVWYVSSGMVRTIWEYKMELAYLMAYGYSLIVTAAYAVTILLDVALNQRFQMRVGLVVGLLCVAVCHAIDRFYLKPKTT